MILSINDTFIGDYSEGNYARFVMLNVIILSVVMMSVVALLMFIYLAITAICRHLNFSFSKTTNV